MSAVLEPVLAISGRLLDAGVPAQDVLRVVVWMRDSDPRNTAGEEWRREEHVGLRARALRTLLRAVRADVEIAEFVKDQRGEVPARRRVVAAVERELARYEPRPSRTGGAA
jgi:hypothetical protein